MNVGRRYSPEIDGLRAVAVLAVVASHTALRGTAGGGRGVDVFFVISGFLITARLLDELHRDGGIDLRRFYVRRVRRLTPALVVMLGIVAVLFAVVRPFGWRGTLLGVPISAVYAGAWFRGLTSLNMRWLGHTWSLSVEEVFYGVWPAALLAARRRVRPETFVLAAAVVAIAYRNGAAALGASDRWLYSTPDMRAEQVLIGAALAVLLGRQPRLGTRTAGLLGLAGTLVVAAYLLDLPRLPDWYRGGGSTLVALATAAVVASVVTGPSLLAHLLGGRLPVWVGLRSYGIYLWHLPLFGLLSLRGEPEGVRDVARLVAFALALFAADLSYRHLERTSRAGLVRVEEP